jgi:putative transposase
VKINGKTDYLWRALDHEGEVLEFLVTKCGDCQAALAFLRKEMHQFGQPKFIKTGRFLKISYLKRLKKKLFHNAALV